MSGVNEQEAVRKILSIVIVGSGLILLGLFVLLPALLSYNLFIFRSLLA